MLKITGVGFTWSQDIVRKNKKYSLVVVQKYIDHQSYVLTTIFLVNVIQIHSLIIPAAITYA